MTRRPDDFTAASRRRQEFREFRGHQANSGQISPHFRTPDSIASGSWLRVSGLVFVFSDDLRQLTSRPYNYISFKCCPNRDAVSERRHCSNVARYSAADLGGLFKPAR